MTTVREDLDAVIRSIGQRLVACTLTCEGTQRDPEHGIIPRCLVLETDGRANGPGVAVVGLNPGRSSEREQRFYQKNGICYQSVLDFWGESARPAKNVAYYRRLRNLMDDLGLTGPILWTELVKCESPRGEHPPLQTCRTCMDNFLARELEEIPDWSLVGVGREAFTALAYRYPTRTVLGVPYPTGSYGHFPDPRKAFNIEKAVAQLQNGQGQAIWLGRQQAYTNQQ